MAEASAVYARLRPSPTGAREVASNHCSIPPTFAQPCGKQAMKASTGVSGRVFHRLKDELGGVQTGRRGGVVPPALTIGRGSPFLALYERMNPEIQPRRSDEPL